VRGERFRFIESNLKKCDKAKNCSKQCMTFKNMLLVVGLQVKLKVLRVSEVYAFVSSFKKERIEGFEGEEYSLVIGVSKYFVW